ncbi:unnamed protein product, partial [Polarella glacialis]
QKVSFGDGEDEQDYVILDGKRHRMVMKDELYYLRVKIVPPPRQEQIAALPETRRWCIIEWCCHEDSVLTQAFRARGHQGIRLGLFNVDLSKEEDVAKAVRCILEVRRTGAFVLVWVSLPGHPWSSWQLVNIKDPRQAPRLLRQRAASEEMVQKVCEAFEQVKQPGVLGPLSGRVPRSHGGNRLTASRPSACSCRTSTTLMAAATTWWLNRNWCRKNGERAQIFLRSRWH